MLKIILRPANLHRRLVDKPSCLEGERSAELPWRLSDKLSHQKMTPSNLSCACKLWRVLQVPSFYELSPRLQWSTVMQLLSDFCSCTEPIDLQVIPKTLIVHHVRLLFGFVSVLRSVTGSLSGVSTSVHVTSSSSFCMWKGSCFSSCCNSTGDKQPQKSEV